MQSKIRDIMFKVGAAALYILAYAVTSNLENAMGQHSRFYGPQDDWYGLTAKTISKSSMWSSDKTEALEVLLGNGPESYYQSVISIVNSSMWSSDKLTAIKQESGKFVNVMQI